MGGFEGAVGGLGDGSDQPSNISPSTSASYPAWAKRSTLAPVPTFVTFSTTAAMTSTTPGPPFYVLVSLSSLPNGGGQAPSTSLSHPVIEYHYADDSPLSLLPQFPDEQVIVLDYDPTAASTPPTAQSTSKGLVVTGVKVSDAPGAGIAYEETENDKMYILETKAAAATDDKALAVSQQEPYSALVRFKERNAILRQALSYPQPSGPQASQALADDTAVLQRRQP